MANILSFLVPNYNYTMIKYASNLYLELRIDNVCIERSVNPENCFYVRVGHNGGYINLEGQNIYSNSSQIIDPED